MFHLLEALPIIDTLNYLELPINQIFSDLPVQSAPVDPPGGYGCSRDGPYFGLVDPTSSFIEADPLRNGGVPVPILLDPSCSGAAATGPPSVPCTPGSGRVVVDWPDVTAFFDMTCDAVAESLESWEARRAGTEAQLFDEDVEIIAVPEPTGAVLWGAGVLCVSALGRGRQRGLSAG